MDRSPLENFARLDAQSAVCHLRIADEPGDW
jgi:hypothetical protein